MFLTCKHNLYALFMFAIYDCKSLLYHKYWEYTKYWYHYKSLALGIEKIDTYFQTINGQKRFLLVNSN